MRWLSSMVLLFTFLSLGTGALEYLHNWQHRIEDQRQALLHGEHQSDVPHPLHDDSNCPVHAQLHAPLIAVAWVPALVCLGLFVAFLSLLAPPLVSQRALLTIDCRGPPSSGC